MPTTSSGSVTVAAQQMADDRQRAAVGPVQIVEHDEQRSTSRHGGEKRVDRVEEIEPGDRGVTRRPAALADPSSGTRRWISVASAGGIAARTSGCERVNDRTMVDHGKYAADVSWSHQPYAIVASSTVEASSATSRVLPMPGSPDTNANRRRPAATLAHASCIISSSRSRPTHDDRAASTRRRGSHAGATSLVVRGVRGGGVDARCAAGGCRVGHVVVEDLEFELLEFGGRVDTEFVAQVDSQSW